MALQLQVKLLEEQQQAAQATLRQQLRGIGATGGRKGGGMDSDDADVDAFMHSYLKVLESMRAHLRVRRWRDGPSISIHLHVAPGPAPATLMP